MKLRLYKLVTTMIVGLLVLPTTQTLFTMPTLPTPRTMDSGKITALTPNVMINTQQMPGAQLSPESIKKVEPTNTDDTNIYLNFENASLASVINYLGEERKINVLPHKDLDNTKVSLTTRVPLTLDAAWNVALTLIEMNGFTINKVGNLYRVVSNKENGFEPLPVYSSKEGTQPEQLPNTDQVIRYIYFFQNIKVETAQNILSTMLEDNSVTINQDLQVAIIKEKCFNIKAAMKIVKELDTGGLRESIKIIKLDQANAEDVAKIFEQILGQDDKKGPRFMRAPGKKELTYFSTTTKIYPYPAKNSLIMLGTEKNLQRIIDFIYKNVDIPVGSADSRLHIKEIRYAKCEQLKPILDSIIKQPGGGGEKSTLSGQYKFFEDVIIAAEAGGQEGGRGSGNRLIIACNQHDWRRLETIIEKLDKPQPQVAFEVLIIDLSENQFKELGAQFQTKGKLGLGINASKFLNLSDGASASNEPGQESGSIPLDNLVDIAANDQGSASFMTLGSPLSFNGTTVKNIGLWALIRSRIEIDQTNIISQPYVITNNGQECKVEISQTQRVRSLLKTDKGVEPIATFVQKPVGNNITLTPNINKDGIVNLKVDIDISAFVPGAQDLPGETNRVLSTKTSILAGEVLVLGGLKNSQLNISERKTPILGDIPLIGNLFKAKEKLKTESNLYVFIRPSIIKPQFENAPDEYTQLKLDYAKLNLMRNDLYVQDKDPIQRWFFKPSDQTVRQRISEAKSGIFKPIDDFAYGRRHPRSVNIRKDPYFKVSESLAKTDTPVHSFEKPLTGNQPLANMKQRATRIRNIT